MPNHIHGIVEINNDSNEKNNKNTKSMNRREDFHCRNYNVGEDLRPSPTNVHGLSEIIRALKSFSSLRINKISGFKFK